MQVSGDLADGARACVWPAMMQTVVADEKRDSISSLEGLFERAMAKGARSEYTGHPYLHKSILKDDDLGRDTIALRNDSGSGKTLTDVYDFTIKNYDVAVLSGDNTVEVYPHDPGQTVTLCVPIVLQPGERAAMILHPTLAGQETGATWTNRYTYQVHDGPTTVEATPSSQAGPTPAPAPASSSHHQRDDDRFSAAALRALHADVLIHGKQNPFGETPPAGLKKATLKQDEGQRLAIALACEPHATVQLQQGFTLTGLENVDAIVLRPDGTVDRIAGPREYECSFHLVPGQVALLLLQENGSPGDGAFNLKGTWTFSS
jgi:hypothetical protein